ncbi:hypothetical protein CBFG_06063 [Clostridiales bacterium 1_7_47FAA]|nr:hypothetical protein CBFG_06063 [Clostridiales bacterium 1_7_47FAA]
MGDAQVLGRILEIPGIVPGFYNDSLYKRVIAVWGNMVFTVVFGIKPCSFFVWIQYRKFNHNCVLSLFVI